MRRPDKIILGLVGAGVLGTAGMVAYEFSKWSKRPTETQLGPDSPNEWSSPADVPALSENQEYPNDYYVPNVGYYHAPYHSFYPYRFNTYEAGRGYYHGGSWWPTALASAILYSRPQHSEVVRAAQVRSTYSSSRTSPFASSGSRTTSTPSHSSSSPSHGTTGSSGSSSSKSGGSSSSGSVSHGGFGSTGHSSGSSSSSSSS